MVFKKLEELGYKKTHYYIVGEEKNLHGVIIGEEHFNNEHLRDQVEIIKHFKSKVVFHEGISNEKAIENYKPILKDLDEAVKSNNLLETLLLLKEKHGIKIRSVDDEKAKTEMLKHMSPLLKTFDPKIKQNEEIVKEYMSEFDEEIKSRKNTINETFKKLINYIPKDEEEYNSFLKAYSKEIINKLNENSKEFIESCEKHNLSKEELRNFLLCSLFLKTKEKINKRLSKIKEKDSMELINMYKNIEKLDHDRNKTMLEKILNEEEKFVAIMGQNHAKFIENELKKLQSVGKVNKNLLFVHQAFKTSKAKDDENMKEKYYEMLKDNIKRTKN